MSVSLDCEKEDSRWADWHYRKRGIRSPDVQIPVVWRYNGLKHMIWVSQKWNNLYAFCTPTNHNHHKLPCSTELLRQPATQKHRTTTSTSRAYEEAAQVAIFSLIPNSQASQYHTSKQIKITENENEILQPTPLIRQRNKHMNNLRKMTPDYYLIKKSLHMTRSRIPHILPDRLPDTQ